MVAEDCKMLILQAYVVAKQDLHALDPVAFKRKLTAPMMGSVVSVNWPS